MVDPDDEPLGEDESPPDDDALLDDEESPADDEVTAVEERPRHGEPLTGDYGIDAPTLVRGVSGAAVAALALTVIIGIINVLWLMVTTFLLSGALTLLALGMVRYSRVTKLRMRPGIVDRLEVEGAARVIDVGCGRGLLTVEAARRLDEDGMTIGIDIWRDVDQSENDPEAVYENADIEAVSGHVEVVTSEARALPFADASFDAAVSQLAIHNIHGSHGRAQAVREMERVLHPGGRLVIVDLRHTGRYVEVLRALNWTGVERTRLGGRPRGLRIVTGTKPTTEPDTIQWPLPEVDDVAPEGEEVEAQEPEPEGEPEPATAEAEAEPELEVAEDAEPEPDPDVDEDDEPVETAEEEAVSTSAAGNESPDQAVS